LFSLAIADGDGAVVKIQVLDPQAQTFHQPQAGAVEQPGHEQAHAGEVGKNAVDLVSGQDGGQAFRFLGAQGINGAQVLVQHLAVEEEQRAEGVCFSKLNTWFWVEAATFSFTARWARKAWTSPISAGWRTLWK
jgi:hypothetical protein